MSIPLFLLLAGMIIVTGCGQNDSTINNNSQPAEILDGRSEQYFDNLELVIEPVGQTEKIFSEGIFTTDKPPVISWKLSGIESAGDTAVTSYLIKVGTYKNSADMWLVKNIPADIQTIKYGETPKGSIEVEPMKNLTWGNYFVRVEAYYDDRLLGFGEGGIFIQ